MKSVFGIVLAGLSIFGLAHHNSVVTPPQVAVKLSSALWQTSGQTASVAASNSVVATAQPSPTPAAVQADTTTTVSLSPANTGPVVTASGVSPAPVDSLAGYVTQQALSLQMSDLSASVRQLIYNANAQSTSSLYASLWGAIALSQRIDTLPSTVTVGGSTVVTQASLPTLSGLSGLLGISRGGTGITTVPTYGQVLVGDGNGNYTLVATSSLGLAGGGSSPWAISGSNISYNAGNVGIGTTSASALLAIDSTSTTGTIIRIANGSTGGHVYDFLETGSGNTGGAGRLDFFDRTANTARLSIAANGNVGIGTTSPFTNFAVNGSGYFSDALSASNISTSGTLTAQGAGTSSLGGNLTIQDQIFYDAFNRPNQAGLGTAPNGQSYLTTGAGVGTLEVSNNSYTGSGFIYAGILATTTPTRIGGTFSFSATTSASFALISSNDGSILLQHMLHLVITSTGLTLSWWINSSQDNIIGCTGPEFPSTLQQNGTVYSVYESISTSTNTVHITDPFGQSLDCYDPHISQVAGNLTIWEISDTGFDQNWHSTEQDALVTQADYGSVTATAGFQGPVGNISPSAVFANSISVGTSTTNIPLEIQNNLATDGLRIDSAGAGATLRLKTIGAGYSPAIYFDQGEANVPYIYSSGSANDLRLNVGGVDRITLPSTGNVGIGTTTPKGVLSIESDSSADGIRIDSTASGAILRLKADTGGFSPALYFDEGQTNPDRIYSAGNANDIRIATNGTDRMVFVSGGGVGVNTATPKSTFDVAGSLSLGTYGGVTAAPINGLIISGNVGIGTTTPYSRLTVWGSDTASSTSAFSIVNSASTTEFQVFDGGNAQLSGTLTQNSDERLKTNITSLDASSSLAAIDALNPVTFNWIDPTESTAPQIGFIAQQVQELFPALISTTSPTPLTPGGTLGLNYIGLISPIVSAIQSLSAEVTSLEATVTGFAQSFTSDKVTTKEICVEKSDGSTLCVSGDQLAAALSGGSSGSQVQISEPTPLTISGTTTPPSINVQGDNPSVIQVGDTYTDLGAIATDNQGDSLGYKTFLNGTFVSNIVIDTSQVATDTIDYVATDTWGNTATSTRTIIIDAAASSAAYQ